MKTLLDRLNLLFTTDYLFRKIYMLSVAAEDEPHFPEKAVSGLQAGSTVLRKLNSAAPFSAGE